LPYAISLLHIAAEGLQCEMLLVLSVLFANRR